MGLVAKLLDEQNVILPIKNTIVYHMQRFIKCKMHKVDKVICSKPAKILWRKKKKRIAKHLKLKNTHKKCIIVQIQKYSNAKKNLKHIVANILM